MVKRTHQLSRWLDQPPKLESEKAAMNAEMQSLDRDVTRAFSIGGKNGKQIFKSPYSPKVINQRQTIRYWKLWQTEVRTRTDMFDQRADLFQEIDWQGDEPLLKNAPSLCQIQGKLRAVTKASRKLLVNAKSE